LLRLDVIDAVKKIDPASAIVTVKSMKGCHNIQRQFFVTTQLPHFNHSPVNRKLCICDELKREVGLTALSFAL